MQINRWALFTFVAAIMTTAAFAGPNRWTTTGPKAANIKTIAGDPDNPDIAYVLTYFAGIYRTIDGGQNWRAIDTGLPSLMIDALCVAPEATYAVINADVFGTTDAGAHWSMRGHIGNVYVNSLKYNPAWQELFADTSGGLFRSNDAGQTWSLMTLPPGDRSDSSIGFSPAGAAYGIGTLFGVNVSNLMRSVDRGQTWTFVNGPVVSSLAIDPASGTIYGGNGSSILVSRDDAKSWTSLPSPGVVNSIVAVANALYAATPVGAFKYDERSSTWTAIGTPLPLINFAVSGSTARRFYTTETSGILTIGDGDPKWTPANNGLPGADVVGIAVAPSEPAVAYAATGDGISKTTDGGRSWIELPIKAAFSVETIDAPDTVYATTNYGGVKSTDGGSTWTRVTPDFASVFAVAPSDASTLYAALSSGMAKSTDSGRTWAFTAQTFGGDGYEYFYGFIANSIAVAPSNSSVVLLGLSGDLFRTENGGATWHLESVKNMGRAVIDPADPSIAYAASRISGVMMTANGGADWTAAGLTDKTIIALALNGTALYAGSTDGHIYASTDRGQHWTGLDDGLRPAMITTISFDSSGNYLYAGTMAGAYQYQILHQDIHPEWLTDDPLRLPHVIDGMSTAPGSGFVLPVAGTVAGAAGELFSTEITLTNGNEAAQDVLVSVLPQQGDARSFKVTIPASSDVSGGTLQVMDAADQFGFSGLASLTVVAVDANGEITKNATIGASERIWMQPADGRAPRSQSIPYSTSEALAEHTNAAAVGLREDAQFRSNVGIVNLSGDVHQFTIQVNGERSSAQFTIAVAPFTLAQTSLPDGDYGALSIDVIADTNARWLFYGSSIDRTTGDAETHLGAPDGH